MYVMVILLVANQTQYFALPNPEVPTISDPEKVDFGDKTNNFGTELVMEGGGREAVRRAYDELRLAHPELPNQLRDFQVAWVKRFRRRQWHATANCDNWALLVMGKARRWRNIYDLLVKMMTGTFIIADRLCCFHPKKTPTIWTGGGDMRQANSNHHQQEILLQIVTNTVENEFERCFHQIIITLDAEVGWAANANAGIDK